MERQKRRLVPVSGTLAYRCQVPIPKGGFGTWHLVPDKPLAVPANLALGTKPTFYARNPFFLVKIGTQCQSLPMAKLATLVESPYQRSINAMVLLYDTVHSDYARSVVMEAFTQIAFRAWGWNVEKFYSEFKAAQNGQG